MKVTLEMERTELNNLFDYIIKKIKHHENVIETFIGSGDIQVTYDYFGDISEIDNMIEFEKAYQADIVGELITLIGLYEGLEGRKYSVKENLVQLLHLYRAKNYWIKNKERK